MPLVETDNVHYTSIVLKCNFEILTYYFEYSFIMVLLHIIYFVYLTVIDSSNFADQGFRFTALLAAL